jgi:hypothetical protein
MKSLAGTVACGARDSLTTHKLCARPPDVLPEMRTAGFVPIDPYQPGDGMRHRALAA